MLEQAAVFNDGVVELYETYDAAAEGDMPVEQIGATPKERLRFERRVVGVTRFWAAQQQNEQIDELIRCPRREVSARDIAVIAGVRYAIKQIQYPRGIEPSVMDLTLQRMVRDGQD